MRKQMNDYNLLLYISFSIYDEFYICEDMIYFYFYIKKKKKKKKNFYIKKIR